MINPNDWKIPWRSSLLEAEITGLQRQLEYEITSAHPLWGKSPKVLGRRIDCDDVLVETSDGKVANVHLTWSAEMSPYPVEYPRTIIFETLELFLEQMRVDAIDHGVE